MKFEHAVLALGLLLSLPVISEPAYKSSAQIAPHYANDTAENAAMRKVTKISMAEAQRLAQKAAPGAHLVKTELDSEDGNVVYEVEFTSNGFERKVIIDAGNGKVLSNSLDKD